MDSLKRLPFSFPTRVIRKSNRSVYHTRKASGQYSVGLYQVSPSKMYPKLKDRKVFSDDGLRTDGVLHNVEIYKRYNYD